MCEGLVYKFLALQFPTNIKVIRVENLVQCAGHKPLTILSSNTSLKTSVSALLHSSSKPFRRTDLLPSQNMGRGPAPWTFQNCFLKNQSNYSTCSHSAPYTNCI